VARLESYFRMLAPKGNADIFGFLDPLKARRGDGVCQQLRQFLNEQVGIPIPTAPAPGCRVWKPDLQNCRYLNLLRSDSLNAYESEREQS